MYENDVTNGNGINEMEGGNIPPKKKMPAGAIVGIVIGCVLLVVGIVVVFYRSSLQPKSIELRGREKDYLAVDKTYTLSYDILPENAISKNVTFTSSNSSVATVDENGKITAKKDGEAVITVTTSNGLTDEMTIVVSELYNDWEWIAVNYKNKYYTDYELESEVEFTQNKFTIKSEISSNIKGTWEYEETLSDGTIMYNLTDGKDYMLASVSEDVLMIMLSEDWIFIYEKK